MNHYSYEQWKDYVKNDVDESVRKMYEDHLYSCDQCLGTYLDAVADCAADLPVIENEDHFTDLVMAHIKASSKEVVDTEDLSQMVHLTDGTETAALKEKRHKTGADKKKTPFYQRTVFHYTVAAAMTFILMSSGVFQTITDVAVSVSDPEREEEIPSVTEGFLDKTFAWVDSLSFKNEEGK